MNQNIALDIKQLPIIIALCFGLLANPGYGFGQDDSKQRSVTMLPKPMEPSFRVQVIVQADEQLKNMIESFIKRELRSLNDVAVTDKDPRYVIGIVALQAKAVEGAELDSIALSLVIRASASTVPISSLTAPADAEREPKDNAVDVYKGTDTLIQHGLFMTPIDGLKRACEEIIADFDSDALEPRRKLHQSIDSKDQELSKDHSISAHQSS
jgi:hypothetical protein